MCDVHRQFKAEDSLKFHGNKRISVYCVRVHIRQEHKFC